MTTPLLELRRKQIQSFLQSNYNIVQIQPDTSFEISYNLPSLPYPLVLCLFLPPLFPQQDNPPRISVKTLVSHPLVNSQGLITGFEPILLGKWTQHTSLSRVFKDLLQEFISRPPRPLNQTPITAARKSFSNAPIHPCLAGKSIQELTLLLQDEDAFLDFFEGLEQVKSSLQMETDLIEKNAQLCKSILSKNESVQQVKQDFDRLYNQQTSEKQVLDELSYQKGSELQKFSRNAVETQFKRCITISEKKSEAILENFMNDAISTDEFLKEYRKARNIYHLRCARLERFVIKIDEKDEWDPFA